MRGIYRGGMDFRGLTSWVDGMEESDVPLVHVDGTHDEETIIEVDWLQ